MPTKDKEAKIYDGANGKSRYSAFEKLANNIGKLLGDLYRDYNIIIPLYFIVYIIERIWILSKYTGGAI